MDDVQAGAPAVPTTRPRGDDRRRRILQALHDCVIERGYAKTTLADVARAAGMSPSHLLYYYEGTDAILAQFFSNVAQRIANRLDSIRNEPPAEQIQLLADLFFAGKAIKRSEAGFMLECFGVAVHDKRLWQAKTALDEYCKAFLRQLFERSPCGPSRAEASAEIAYAMLVGMRTMAYFDEKAGPRTMAYFDEKAGPQHVRTLFQTAMTQLANSGLVA